MRGSHTAPVSPLSTPAEKKQPPLDLAMLRQRPTCSIDDAAAVLGIGRSTAYAAARDGSLPVLRIARRLLVPTAKLLAMIGLARDDEDEAAG